MAIAGKLALGVEKRLKELVVRRKLHLGLIFRLAKPEFQEFLYRFSCKGRTNGNCSAHWCNPLTRPRTGGTHDIKPGCHASRTVLNEWCQGMSQKEPEQVGLLHGIWFSMLPQMPAGAPDGPQGYL